MRRGGDGDGREMRTGGGGAEVMMLGRDSAIGKTDHS